MTPIPHTEWRAAAVERYGKDWTRWRFRCPVCKVETTLAEWAAAGAHNNAVAFSCIGRYLPDGQYPAREFATKPGTNGLLQPCDYAGGGLFGLNPVPVEDGEGGVHHLFDFADRPLAQP